MDEIVKEFLQESTENLDSLDQQFVRLEGEPDDREMLSSIFRTIHTIKGTTGFLGFHRLEALTHAGENLLSRLRDGELRLTPEMISSLLAMVDVVRRMLAEIESSGSDGDRDEAELISALNAHANGGLVQKKTKAAKRTRKQPAKKASPAEIAPPQPTKKPVQEETKVVMQPTAPPPAKSIVETSVRVDVALLDQLMDLMGELVLARNQIVQYAVQSQDSAFASLSQRLNMVTSDLRERVTKTRMQPVEQLFQKLPAMVRGVAVACGKKVNLKVSGNETEIDRSVLDAIRDPIMHAVRNAVDHGIEVPEIRLTAGKSDTGNVQVSASHDSGYVLIEIKDDGAGLNSNALRNKAVERGLITREAADRLDETKVRELIFLPGFSTAATVSNISGRGVGMDVVRTNVEKIGGTVELQSEYGQGTILRFRIPLTLAIIPALMVQANGQAFALPQVSLVELIRIPQSEGNCTEMLGDALVYRLRGQLLPLAALPDLLTGGKGNRLAGKGEQELTAIVLRFGARHFGLIVDEVEDAEEIVVKPLGRLLSQVPLFGGATVRGDGNIALILDVNAVATHSQLFEKQRRAAVAEERQEVMTKATRRLLHVEAGGPAAIEIHEISRIEQLSPRQIEMLNGRPVFQYQGRIVPLIDRRSRKGDDGTLPVLICEYGGRTAGVAVDRVYDSTEEELELDERWSHNDACGAAILQGQVTNVLSLGELVRSQIGEI